MFFMFYYDIRRQYELEFNIEHYVINKSINHRNFSMTIKSDIMY